MSPSDLEAGVSYMEARWGYQKVWGSWPELYQDFAAYSTGALKQALNDWYRAGNQFAPKPAQLRKAVADIARQRIEAGVDEMIVRPCDSHTWATPHPHDEDRHFRCVVCGSQGPVAPCVHMFDKRGWCAYCSARREEVAS